MTAHDHIENDSSPEPVVQPPAAPAVDEQPELPATTPAETPVETPAESPAETPAESAAETPVDETADSAAGTPAENAAETPVDETAASAAGTPAEDTAETPAEMPVESAAETPVESAAETPVESVPNDRPAPIPVPRPGPRPPSPAVLAKHAPAPAAEVAPTVDEPPSGLVDEAEAATWGRVTEDGTVFVRTADGEREVGQFAAGSPDDALAFFTRRYAALATEVDLLERRVGSAAMSPEEARTSVAKVRELLTDAHAVGDLDSLTGRLEALAPVLAQQREARREERAKKTEESRVRKEQIVTEAEKLGAGRDWRNGANRLRDLLEEWKGLPRLDRPTDDALWHRFSTARTTYTRARKAHFSELDEKRGEAKAVKERLIKEAEALSASTEWGPTAGKYRDLMTRWKAAGPAAKAEDDALWKRFRSAQDAFFGAREAQTAAEEEEFTANAAKKDAILLDAEALLPVRNLDAAKRAWRDIADRWEAAGKVPRNRMKDLEARIRVVEQAIRGAEDDKWKRSDPEKSARADDMIGKLEKAIADIEAGLVNARDRGDARAVKQLESDLAGRQMFLDAARRTAAEFG
jgi:hypothetical protein